jgi:3-hydroxybutyryl-CoA dehydrogenase
VETVRPDNRVAVIGSGRMGAGIAQVAAAAGHPVSLYDVNSDAVSSAIQGVRESFQKLVAKKRMTAEVCGAAQSRLGTASSIGELKGAKLVIEAVLEDLETKRQVFREAETVVDDDCILASNTSSLSITAIAAGLRRPERVAGMHFFNPAPVMELVEVISGLTTDAACADAVFATAASWGKTPVHVKSTPGFIVNRVARPYYGEALRLLSEDAATPASIDAILRESGGFRMGPFELMDLIGHDVNFAVTKSIFEAYFGDRRYTPSLIQQEMVEAGFLGRKSGRGFYWYGENTPAPDIQTEPNEVFFGDAAGVRVALAEKGSIETSEVTIQVSDGRTATQLAWTPKNTNIVVVDLALDYRKAARLAVAKAASCSEQAYRSAVALLQAAGFSVTRVRDLPGLVVLRTVVMLANEAADAVNQGICTVDAVNTAMKKGVNYPLGPLEWADRIGVGKVWAALHNIRSYYGEERYRVSPLLFELLASRRKFDEFQLP